MENKEFTEIVDETKVDNGLTEVDALREKLSFLKKVDFNNTDIDVVETFKNVYEIEKLSKKIKEDEVANVSKTLAPKYLNFEYVEELVDRQNTLESFFAKYKIEDAKTFTEEQKDRLFAIFRYAFIEYQTLLNNMNVNFTLKVDQYKALSNILDSKMNYTIEEVHHIVELEHNLLTEMDKAFKNEKEASFVTPIKNIMVLYHLLSKHTFKGVSKELYEYYSIVATLQEINEVYRKFITIKERIGKQYEEWVSKITDPNQPLAEEVATGVKLTPNATA